MNNIKQLSPSQEDYLETILILEEKNRVARVKDISERLSVKMPSVTGALKNLKKAGFIEYEKNSYITLTEKGRKVAKCILSRHKIILRFLNRILGLEGAWVENQACRIEHSINHETAVRISGLTKWLEENIINSNEMNKGEWNRILRENGFLDSEIE